MIPITMEFPDDLHSAMKLSPEEFGRELRLAAATHWYELGRISQEKAALIAGLSRSQFLVALARGKSDAFVLKLNSAGTSLVFSTYLRGNFPDSANSIAVDSTGLAYVAGACRSRGLSGTFSPGRFRIQIWTMWSPMPRLKATSGMFYLPEHACFIYPDHTKRIKTLKHFY